MTMDKMEVPAAGIEEAADTFIGYVKEAQRDGKPGFLGPQKTSLLEKSN